MSTNDEKVARRYARALFELCAPFNSGGHDLASTRAALDTFARSWGLHTNFREAVLNPAIQLSQRLAAVQEHAKLIASTDPIFANFLVVLLENGRLGMISAISREFSLMVEAFQRVLALDITSALPLSEGEKNQIQSDIQAKVPSQFASMVSINWLVDAEILGGLRIKIGDKLLDSSIRGSLDRIERDLNSIGSIASAAAA